MYYIGIDGGGTKTSFALIDGKGKIYSVIENGTCHYKQIGFDGLRDVINQGIKQLLSKAKLSIEDISYIYMGIPGYGEVKSDAMSIEKSISSILENHRYTIGNDVEAGWAGSLACQDGINIVAGTGTIGIGRDSHDNTQRASGWGHFCGDEGSAYWIGKKLIENFCKQSDYRIERTKLYEIVKTELNLNDDFDIIKLVLDEYNMDRGKIADIARIAHKSAIEGDEYATIIFKEAAFEYGLIVKAVLKNLRFKDNEEILVSYSGGVFKAGEYILRPLEAILNDINPNIKLINPILSPVLGAALYALKIHNKNFDISDVVKNLEHYIC